MPEILKTEDFRPIEPADLFWGLVRDVIAAEKLPLRQAVEKVARAMLEAQGEWEICLESRRVPFRNTVAFHVEQDYLTLRLDGATIHYRRETRKL